MRGLSNLFRAVSAAVLALGLWGATAPSAGAAGVEYLMVPSPAMGRDIPVAFLAGGPHAVVLLDAYNAGDGVSNWVTAGNAMNTLAGKGISVAAPASGAFTLYTNWEQDGTRQWETFLSDELPNWLAANKGLAPSGHAIVGAAQGGTGAMMEATFHPDRYRYAGSLSAFLTPSRTFENGAITAGMNEFGGVNTQAMWGAAQLGRWKWHDPDVHVNLLVAQQHPAVGRKPADLHVQRSAGDDRLLRSGHGQQPDLLRALPGAGRRQRALRLPDQRRARLGQLGCSAGCDGERHCGGDQIVRI